MIRDGKYALTKKAAWIIADAIQDLLEAQDYVVLAVPGGRSVSGIFEELKTQDINWEKVHVFMVDERLVPIDDKESNFLLVKDHLAKVIPQKNIHPFIFDEKVDDKGTKSYEETLQDLGGRFDIVLVSSGEDGHIGGLYPNHHSVSDESDFFITMVDSPKDPPKRMSSSRTLIEQAQVGIILFFGDAKKDVLKNYVNPKLEVNSCPAKIIARLPQVYVLTDQEVASHGEA